MTIRLENPAAGSASSGTGASASVTSANFNVSTPLVVSGGTGAVLNSNVTLSITTATSVATGVLASGDFSTFSNKWAVQTTGNVSAIAPVSATTGSQTLSNPLTISITTANITGTVNQVLVSGGSGAIMAATTFSLPQSIGTASTVIFSGVTASSATSSFQNIVAGVSIFTSITASAGTSTFSVISSPKILAGASVFTGITASSATSSFQNIVAGASIFTSVTLNVATDTTALKIKRGTDAGPTANLIETYKNDNATLLALMAFDGRLRLAIASASPTITTGTGAGTGATASLTGTDSSGEITTTTAGLPSTASVIVTVNFNRAFTNSPAVEITPSNAATALLSGTSMVFATSTTAAFSLTSGSAALLTGTTYKWFYHCFGQ